MGEWLDFGQFDDPDELDEDAEAAELDAEPEDGVLVCDNCRCQYEGESRVVLRTIVDITQVFPALQFTEQVRLARLTVRTDGKVVEACASCWGRDTWSQIQRSYGYRPRTR